MGQCVDYSVGRSADKSKNQSTKCRFKEAGFRNFDFLFLTFDFLSWLVINCHD